MAPQAHSGRSATSRFLRACKKHLSLKSVVTSEDRKFQLRGWQIVGVIVGSILISAAMDWMGRFDLSRPVLAIIGSLVVAIRLRWRLRHFVWFWTTLLVYLALGTLLTVSLTWSTDGPSRGIIGGIMGISVYALFVVLHAFELHMKTRSLPASADYGSLHHNSKRQRRDDIPA